MQDQTPTQQNMAPGEVGPQSQDDSELAPPSPTLYHAPAMLESMIVEDQRIAQLPQYAAEEPQDMPQRPTDETPVPPGLEAAHQAIRQYREIPDEMREARLRAMSLEEIEQLIYSGILSMPES
jgi:hypothetical protein